MTAFRRYRSQFAKSAWKIVAVPVGIAVLFFISSLPVQHPDAPRVDLGLVDCDAVLLLGAAVSLVCAGIELFWFQRLRRDGPER